jgi:hypothetical protein
MDSLTQDLRYGLRGFLRSPGFTAATLLSLAIGIGANTSIFSVANALLLRPLPYRDPDRLVILWNRSPGLGITQDWFSTAQYFDIRNNHSGFEQLAIAIGGKYTLTSDGEPERVGVARVSSSLLPLLGGRAVLGRLFSPDDDDPGRAPSAILTHDFWQRRYGGDPHMADKTVILDGVAYPVAGILPPGFRLPHQILPILTGPDQSCSLFQCLRAWRRFARARTTRSWAGFAAASRCRRRRPKLTRSRRVFDATTPRSIRQTAD